MREFVESVSSCVAINTKLTRSLKEMGEEFNDVVEECDSLWNAG